MSHKLKLFTFSLIASLPFWWGVNVLAKNSENLFFNFTTLNQRAFKAAVISGFEDVTRKNDFGELELKAKAAGSLLISEDGSQIFVFKKNINEQLPIASLTKLMAADVILENFPLSQKVAIKPEISRESINDSFKAGETFSVKDLLSTGLIESNNSAMKAIAETIGERAFVDLMNLEAEYLVLEETRFSNSTGLDPKDEEPDLINPVRDLSLNGINLSTVKDLMKLAEHILKNPVILQIIGQREFELYTFDGNFHHSVVTTNEFLKSGFSFENKEIIGGKTGQTKRAGECLILILRIPEKNGFLINVVLGSEDRFKDMEKIIRWVSKTYEI